MLTDSEINLIYDTGRDFKINPLVLLMKMEQESGLLRNNMGTNKYYIRKFRACGFGLYISSKTNRDGYTLGTNASGKVAYYRYGGFKTQITECAELLRKHFNAWSKSTPVMIKDFNPTGWEYYVKNASTYTLFRYCPYYGDFYNGKFKNVGNRIVHSLWKEIKGRSK